MPTPERIARCNAGPAGAARGDSPRRGHEDQWAVPLRGAPHTIPHECCPGDTTSARRLLPPLSLTAVGLGGSVPSHSLKAARQRASPLTTLAMIRCARQRIGTCSRSQGTGPLLGTP